MHEVATMTHEDLRDAFQAAGWRIYPNAMAGRENAARWLACKPSTAVRDCECNDKPPQMVAYPHDMTWPDMPRHLTVTFDLTGEFRGEWWKLEAYGVAGSVALEKAPEIEASLARAWQALEG